MKSSDPTAKKDSWSVVLLGIRMVTAFRCALVGRISSSSILELKSFKLYNRLHLSVMSCGFVSNGFSNAMQNNEQ